MFEIIFLFLIGLAFIGGIWFTVIRFLWRAGSKLKG